MENSRRIDGAGLFAVLAAALLPVLSSGAQAAQRVSGPYEHHNLAVYLVHADGATGSVIGEVVTLDAALAAGHVVLHETGNVSQLSIENTSRHQTVFVQAGDIVKGGKQDRVLTQDLILRPRSGQVSIDAFCVESGRWSARQGEEVSSFKSSKKALSSKALKMAARSAKSQQEVWREVEVLQDRLSDALKTPVASPKSKTSLQLSLENDQLAETKKVYLEALAPLGSDHDDAIGFAIAINGAIQTAEVYSQPRLFRALWAKQLDAAATEAIASLRSAGPPAPPPAAVNAFLRTAQRGNESVDDRPDPARSAVRETRETVFFESRTNEAPETWLHRSYIAK
ncbi:MAG: ARPP-1 family domain-containing protein [Gammaproteobacteria bacterium]